MLFGIALQWFLCLHQFSPGLNKANYRRGVLKCTPPSPFSACGQHAMAKAVGLLPFSPQHPTTGQKGGLWPPLTLCEQAGDLETLLLELGSSRLCRDGWRLNSSLPSHPSLASPSPLGTGCCAPQSMLDQQNSLTSRSGDCNFLAM